MMPETLKYRDVDPEFLTNKVIADAARFQETLEVAREWLYRLEIYVAEINGWMVFLMDLKVKGRELSRHHFSTYPEALTFALTEAEKRLKVVGRAPLSADMSEEVPLASRY